MTASAELKRTPLYDRHVALGARVVEFGGWEMPVQYSGIVDEHNAVRNAAGLFDISHMGEVEVKGRDALAFLQHIATQDVATIGEGQSNYALLCRPDGGIVDDIFIYHLPDGYMVVVNASNIEKDFAWMLDNMPGFDVELTNISDRASMLALQGPLAEAILAKATDIDVMSVPFHGVTTGMLLGDIPALIARTGYTGEDGFELFVDDDKVEQLWDGLLELGKDDGLKPCGLGARDSLRFEACLALYGHEIADDINPYEAKLGWVVKLDKGDFVGRASIAADQAGRCAAQAGRLRGDWPRDRARRLRDPQPGRRAYWRGDHRHAIANARQEPGPGLCADRAGAPRAASST